MSVKPLNNQVYFSGGPVDGRTVVATEANITSISNAYVGMGVTVLNNGSPKKYTIKKLTILGKPDTKANGGYEEDIDTIGAASKESVSIIADKLNKLPSGMYYGQYSSVDNLPAISSLEQKGYAYVASVEPNVYYIYLYNGDGEEWQDSGNKFVTTELETNLSTKSQIKAPTTKAVKEGIEAIDVTTEQEFTSTQKENARTNIGAQESIPEMQDKFPVVAALNDRAAVVAPVTNEIKALGYKVLNPSLSFASQVVEENTVYEIRDFFDISGTEQEPAMVTIPANCKLRFEGGMLGGEFVTLQGNNTLIESDSVCIQKNVKIAGTWGNDIIYTKWLEFVSVKDAYLPAAVGTAGVMAPFFEDATYYKSGRNYEKLTDTPADWQTNYMDYYKIVDNQFVSVEPVAPAYSPNTYWEYVDGQYVKLLDDNAPADWETDFAKYYVNNTGTHVSGIAPNFDENVYYKDEGVGYEELRIQPDDWYANWSSYYIKDGNEYVTPMGVINNPNATDNALEFKQLQALINGTKGCKVEFEKGYYQAALLGKPRGTVDISGVTYEKWPTNVYQRDEDTILNIFELPFLDLNLNGSKVVALKTNSPSWAFFRFNGVENLKIHDGELEGFANHFDYPQYWNRTNYPDSKGAISRNYEQVWLLMIGGGSSEVYNMKIHNSTGNAFSVERRSWYFASNQEVKSYPTKSGYVHDCEFYDCGRNGMGFGDGEYITLERLEIHHVGSFSGSGTIDVQTNIMGLSPMAGIDIESDEVSNRVNPIVRWDSLNIYKCVSKAFGFAAPNYSRIKSFHANNLTIEGGIVPNNITTDDGAPTFTNSKITFSYGTRISLLGAALYDNCEFIFEVPIVIGSNTFNNCKFIDNLANPAEFNSGGYSKTMYNNCYFLIKNLTNLRNSSFKSCQLKFDTRKFAVRVGGSTFDNCTLTALQNIGGYNVSFNSENYNYPVVFDKCIFNNILGRGNNLSDRAFTGMQVSFNNCIGDIKIATFDNDILIKDCHGSLISMSGYNLATKSVIVSGCDFKSWTIIDVPSDNQTLVVEDSKVTFSSSSSSGQCRSHAIFRRCDITYKQTGFSLVSNNQIFDSVVNFTNNVANSSSENKISLTNSYIKGAATQAAFKGAVTDCVFANAMPTQGTTTNRPSSNNMKVGFKYFDTTLGKPIFWNGVSWVDGNGAYIFDNSGSLQNRLALTSLIKGQQFKLTREGETDVYLIYGDYGWLNATDRSPWFDDSGTLNAMYDKYNYALLISQPSNWATAYNTYYKIVDGVYTKLNAFEEWADDTFYQLDVNTYKGIQVKLTDTDADANGSLTNRIVKWNGTKYINVVNNVALKASTPTLAFGEVEEEIDGEQVSVTQATITSTSTSSGKIYYTKDGNNPTSSSTEYSSAITLVDGDQVKAICIRDHMDNSNIGFVPVAKPVITFNDGILHIECDTPDAKIYYTTDGNPPSTSSTVYDSSASVTIATGIIVKAFAVLIGRVNSEIASEKRS